MVSGGPGSEVQETLAHQWSCHLYYLDTATNNWVEHSGAPTTLCLYTAPVGLAKLVGFDSDGTVSLYVLPPSTLTLWLQVLVNCQMSAETVC